MTVDSFSLAAAWPTLPGAAERDVAQIQLSAAGEVFTRVSDFEKKEERDFFRASAVSLALWFAENWWRLRFESLPDGSPPSTNWRLRHELTSAAGGTLWPPLMLHSTGDRVLLTGSYARPVEIGSIRYIIPQMASVSGDAFEHGVNSFFDQVLGTCAKALDGNALSELVQSIRSERSDPDVASWRRIEARLGYDPDTAPSSLMNAMSELEETVGAEALDEAAASAPGKASANILGEALEAAKASEVIVDLSIAKIVRNSSRIQDSSAPWQKGRDAAAAVRRILDCEHGPLTPATMAKLFGSHVGTRERGTARNLPYSSRLYDRADKHRVALKSANTRDRRFELSCALADHMWSDSSFGVMSKAKTDRQKFQRAFAQNLLVPFHDLKRQLNLSDITEDAIDRSAKNFHVHPNVIKRVLILERILPPETLEDRLEAA